MLNLFQYQHDSGEHKDQIQNAPHSSYESPSVILNLFQDLVFHRTKTRYWNEFSMTGEEHKAQIQNALHSSYEPPSVILNLFQDLVFHGTKTRYRMHPIRHMNPHSSSWIYFSISMTGKNAKSRYWNESSMTAENTKSRYCMHPIRHMGPHPSSWIYFRISYFKTQRPDTETVMLNLFQYQYDGENTKTRYWNESNMTAENTKTRYWNESSMTARIQRADTETSPVWRRRTQRPDTKTVMLNLFQYLVVQNTKTRY